MLGQDRGRRRGGPDPVRPARGTDRPAGAGRFREACVPAGAGEPAVGTLSRPAGPVTQAAEGGTRARWPWRTLLAAVGGLVLVLAFPGYDLVGLAVLGPAALALAVHGQRARVRAVARPGDRSGFLRAAALLDRHLRRPVAVAGPRRVGGRAPGPPRRGHRADLAAAVLAAVDGGAVGGRRGAPRALRPRRLPLGTARASARPRARCSRWPRTAACPLVSFAVALIGTLLAAAVLALVRAWRAAGTRRERGRAAPGRRRPRGRRRWPCRSPAALAWLPLPGRSLTAGGPTVDGRGHPGQRAAGRAGLQRPAPGGPRQPRAAHPRARRRGGGGRGAAARRRPLAGEQLGHRPLHATTTPPGRSTGPPRRSARPILVGAVVEGPGEYVSNTAIVWDPEDGPGDTYVKRHPVPLAEYVPARSFFRFFSDKVDLVRRDFVAGDEVGVLDVGGARLGDLICFEVVYDGLVARRRRGRRRHARRPDQQRHLRLHRRERAAAGA